MPALRPCLAYALAALGWTAFAIPPALAQAADCTWYVETALKQQQRNARDKCGFSGSEWSLSKQAHMAWCASQPVDQWRAAARKREQMLAGCKR